MVEIVDQRYMPPETVKVDLRVAPSLGMDDDARAALATLIGLARLHKLCVAGRFMPDAGVSANLQSVGVIESEHAGDFFRFDRVVLPYSGTAVSQRRLWQSAGHVLVDLTSPRVKRTQAAMGLLKMEGAQTLVIGGHEDFETRALLGHQPSAQVIEDTTDTARLAFSPFFGVVCQTNQSPRRVAWLVQQLRHRYKDARVSFLDTNSPAMLAREKSLEKQLVNCDLVVIVGEPGESSCKALAETALRRGKQSIIVVSPKELKSSMTEGHRTIAFTAGAFALDETVRAVAAKLVGK